MSATEIDLSPNKIQELIQRSLQWHSVTLEGRRCFQYIKQTEQDQRAARERLLRVLAMTSGQNIFYGKSQDR